MEHSLLLRAALFSVLYLLSASGRTLAQNTQPTGCVAAGFSTCCTSLSCLVPEGDCYCDASCYDTSDCCEDIVTTCPQSAQQGVFDNDGSGSGSGSGMGSGTAEPPTTDPIPTPPTILTRPDDPNIFLDISETNRFTIIITHTFGATVEWRKDGEIINSLTDPRVTILLAGGISIRNVRLSDRGSYTVTVSNNVGSDRVSFNLILLFINLVESTISINPESIDLSCTAVGFPDVNFISWRSPSGENVEASLESGAQSPLETTITSILTLNHLTCVSGNYTCLFDNGNGTSVQSSIPVDCVPIQSVELGFEKAVYTVSESMADNPDVAVKVCVTQTGGPVEGVESVTVTVATRNGSAFDGVDFISSSVTRTLSLPLLPRSPDACVCIDIVSDTIVESDEEFSVVLNSSDERIQISRPTALVRIINDDTVTASVARSTYTVSENSSVVEVCVVVVGHFQRDVSVFLCTQSETAVDGVDYIGLGGQRLIFTPTNSAVARQCIDITIIDDALNEGDKTFSVKLQTNPNDSVVILGGIPSATVTIISNDPGPPSVELINDTPRVLGNNVTVDFLLSDVQSVLTAVTCRLLGPGRTVPIVIDDCSSGHAEFIGLPLRLQQFTIMIEGRVNDTTTILTQRDIRLDSDVCWLHPINQGVVIVNKTIAVVEWQATGPRADNKVSSFLCRKDGMRREETCTSPFTWLGISRGRHTLVITPAPTVGCRRHISRVVTFNVE